MNREEDVTGPALRELRLQRGQSLEAFWGEVLTKLGTGYYYETERSPLPPLVRRVCYLHFICGISINATGTQKATNLIEQTDRLNRIASDLRDVAKTLEQSDANNL